MTTRRTGAAGLLLLAGLALTLVLTGPAGASDPGPAYPPGSGADDVVQAGEEPGPGGDGTADEADPAEGERPDEGGTDDEGGTEDGGGDGEVAADGEEASQEAAPTADESRIGPILVVVGTAVLLGGAVVAIARRI